MWKCVFGEMDMCIYLCQNTGAMNRPLRLAECFVVISWVFVALLTIRSKRNGRLSAAVGDRFIVPVYTCSPHIRKTLEHICNPFETHLCNVRNVFVICLLHIRRVKVWFLRCKSMGFSMQKPHF